MTELSSKWNNSVKKGNKLYVGRYDKGTQSATQSKPTENKKAKTYKFNPKTGKLELQ